MKNDFNSTPPTSMMRLSSGRVEHQNVGGVLFITKMLFPKPIPHEECDEQIFHYQCWIEWNNLRKEHEIINLHQWHYLNTVADCWIAYYKKCKELYERAKQ